MSDTLENYKKTYNPEIEAAYDKAVAEGKISKNFDALFKEKYDYKHGMYQALWRGWNGDCWVADYDIEYNSADCMIAILDALLHQGSVPAWPGDGTSCVEQMIAMAYRRRDYWRQRALEAESKLKA